VECLSHFPSVILSGARSGIINILDVRVPENQYQSGHEGIMHPSAVVHIKQINGNLITVAGLDSTLCNYDLRFTKKQPRASSWPNIRSRRMAGHGSKPIYSECTVPVLVYPEHENDAYIDLGFDIDPETGIAAAVQHDEANTVKIFSLKTGGVLKTMDATRVGGSIDTANVKAVRFIQDKEERGMKSLWVAKGTKIIRYAW
jgi:WD40 repeat protein